MLNARKIIHFNKKYWFFLLWLISLIICFIIGLLLPQLPVQISNPYHLILVLLFTYIFAFISMQGSLFVGFKIIKLIEHRDSLNLIKSCFVILAVLMVSIPLLIIGTVWYVGGDLLFRTYIPVTQSSAGNNDSQMDILTNIISKEYNHDIIFAFFLSTIIFLTCGAIFQFLMISSSSKRKEFTSYVFSVETTEKLNNYLKKAKKSIYGLIFVLLFSLILFAFMQEIGLEIIKIILILGYALFFLGLAIYNCVCVLLALEMWKKVETVFQSSLKISKKGRTNGSSLKNNLFNEIRLQINSNDSYLWSLIVFAIPLSAWGILACSAFKLGLFSAIIIISGSLMLSIIFPYQYINHFIKVKSVNYLIECGLPNYLSSLKEILGFRNAIISILIPLFGAISLILSLIGKI